MYEDVKSIMQIQYWNGHSVLYEARTNTEYVVNDLVGNLLKTGRINLLGYKLRNDDDIIELAKILGNKKFETSRILYVKNGEIVGQDAVTIDMPNLSLVHSENSNNIAFVKARQKMDRISADGYYMMHNHPTGDSHVSQEDIDYCKTYASNLNGFLGGIVIGRDNFSVIEMDKNMNPRVEFRGSLNDDRPILNNWTTVIDYIKNTKTEDSSSYVIYTDTKRKLISVQRISNVEFNDKNIFNYINNEKNSNGAPFCFLYTTSSDIYFDACSYTGSGRLFEDVFYSENNYYQSARVEGDNLGMIVKDSKVRPKNL